MAIEGWTDLKAFTELVLCVYTGHSATELTVWLWDIMENEDVKVLGKDLIVTKLTSFQLIIVTYGIVMVQTHQTKEAEEPWKTPEETF